MAYDGLINYSIVRELNNVIINGKIDKIYEPNYEEIILGIYSNSKKYALDLVVNSKYYRANLTTKTKANPTQAPNFCMTLRKYLLNEHIIKIYTNNLERIIFIEFGNINSVKKLIIELMGKHSNIILVNNEDIIIDSLKHFSISSGSYRNIYAGEKYVLPNSDKIDFFEVQNQEEFYRILENNGRKLNTNSLVNIIANTFTGISKTSINSFENDLNISDELTLANSSILYDYICKILSGKHGIKCISYNKDYSITIDDNISNIDQLDINFYLDDYYFEKENINLFTNYRDNLLRLILNKLKKLNTKLDAINEKIKECQDADKYRLYGELITANLYKVPNYNIESITLENYYNNNIPITIPLDKSILPSVNAKKYFKKYQKLKNAREIVNSQKDNVTNDINYLESIIYEIESAQSILDIDEIYSEIKESDIDVKKQNSKSKKNQNSKKQNKVGIPLKFEVDGYTVLAGKNNKQNDYITTKFADKDDIWLHVKDFHGSHVIIRTEHKNPNIETINKCAVLAKEYSKAKQSSNVVVDYALVKYVKKPSGSKPGMVIYTNNKSVIVK